MQNGQVAAENLVKMESSGIFSEFQNSENN